VSTFRKNVKWQLIGSAVQALLGGVLLLIVGRELGAKEFGVFSIVMGFVYVANLLLEPRIQDVAAKQFWNLDSVNSRSSIQTLYKIDFFILEGIGKLLPLGCLAFLSPLLSNYANLSSDGAMLIFVAAGGQYLGKLGYGLVVGLLRVMGRTDIIASCTAGELLFRLALTLLLIKFSVLTPLKCIVVLSLASAIGNATLWLVVLKNTSELKSAARGWKLSDALLRLKENRRLLLSNLGLSASDLMNKDLDITLIASIISTEQIGIYKMAKNIVLLTWRAVDPFYLSLMPEVNRLASKGEVNQLKSLLFKCSIGLLSLAIFLGLLTYGMVFYFGTAVLGNAFSDTAALMPWMMTGIVFSAPLVWGHPLAVALNRADIAFTGSLFGSAIGIITFLALTPLFNTKGAGIAWSLTFICTFLFTSASSFLLLKKLRYIH
jgi:O-antigen/teichoic acid export membrane protein